MNFARQFISYCSILDRYIIVFSSIKEVYLAANKVKLYEIQINNMIEMPYLKKKDTNIIEAI